jgi:ankyrin repeat protein
MVQLLLKKGADVNARDPHNHTALCFLLCGSTVTEEVHSSHSGDTLRLLLDAGADVNVTDFGGATPLM